jgi:hypothetical protein
VNRWDHFLIDAVESEPFLINLTQWNWQSHRKAGFHWVSWWYAQNKTIFVNTLKGGSFFGLSFINPTPKGAGYLLLFKTFTTPYIACAFSACGIGEATSKAGFHWATRRCIGKSSEPLS